ncbi:K02A2.6-like [Cordylochernes scorpioides]|uniref:K02A2.6-like n=1 Tax=Cordylochernes scorpioides TaxID=51811 RepID=A0ABY6L2F4_9ARAC|nr:K02A2.6-like [Cordylochernes scorpioides]
MMSLQCAILSDFCSPVKVCGTNLAQTLVLPKSSCRMVRIVSLLMYHTNFVTTDHFKPPSQFELTTNNAEAWETWKFKFLLYSDAIQLETKPVKQQRAILLHNIGDDALNIYKTFGLQETLTNPTITEILEKFDNHFKPFKNVIYRRYNFFSEVQEKNQSFDDFVTKVKNKAVDCDFVDLTESLIRDRIVLGVLDKNLTEWYLQDPDLTLSKAIPLGRAAESSRTQLKEIKEEVTVDKLSSYKETSSNKNTEHKFVKKNHKLFKACGKCASKHEYGNCPAYGEQCHKCKKPNHYAKCCKNKIVHDIAENDIYMHVISVDNILKDGWFETIYI